MVSKGSVALSISSVVLPGLAESEHIKSFLRNLASMPSIKEVTSHDILDAEGKQLLLEAVKEKKTLFSFKQATASSNNDPVDIQIDFYLKLYRLGRQVVECPQMPASCWPTLLSRMTSIPNKLDPAALFYFVREYFANHHGTQQQQQHVEQPRIEQVIPCKRARLE
jgi:hypothetical protein